MRERERLGEVGDLVERGGDDDISSGVFLPCVCFDDTLTNCRVFAFCLLYIRFLFFFSRWPAFGSRAFSKTLRRDALMLSSTLLFWRCYTDSRTRDPNAVCVCVHRLHRCVYVLSSPRCTSWIRSTVYWCLLRTVRLRRLRRFFLTSTRSGSASRPSTTAVTETPGT